MHLYILLDESGSMDTVKEKTISAFNEYLETMRKENEAGRITLVTFNSFGNKVLIDGERLQTVEGLNSREYKPSGMTPLLDAVAFTIKKGQTENKFTDSKVMVSILTDGLENYSRRFTTEQVNELISQQISKGWAFAFLGANMDAWAVAEKMGISKDSSITYDWNNPDEAIQVLGLATSNYFVGNVSNTNLFEGNKTVADYKEEKSSTSKK